LANHQVGLLIAPWALLLNEVNMQRNLLRAKQPGADADEINQHRTKKGDQTFPDHLFIFKRRFTRISN